MAKNQDCARYADEDYWNNQDVQEVGEKFSRRDSKRYDRKKASIQKARRNKAKQRNSYFDD